MSSIEPPLKYDKSFFEYIRKFSGEHGVEIVKQLIKKKEMTDEELSNKTGIPLNIVRKTLSILLEHSIVAYRVEPGEKAGWFTYYWRLDTENMMANIKVRKKWVIEKLKTRLEHEKNNIFFKCPAHPHVRMTLDEAMQEDFKCPECGSLLVQDDNQKIIRKLEQILSEIEE